MHVVIAQFDVKPECRDAFLAGMEENARTTRRTDPGSVRFDVIQDGEDPNRFFLYEVCRDRAAFEAHLQAPHFLRFQAHWDEWLAAPLTMHCTGYNLIPADHEADWPPARAGA
jgi:autoinducer 2-degrading protein